MDGFFDTLSGAFALIGIVAAVCALWHFGTMQLRDKKGPAESQVLLGGAYFIVICLAGWALFGALSAVAG